MNIVESGRVDSGQWTVIRIAAVFSGRRYGRLLATDHCPLLPPPLDQRVGDSQLIADARDDEIHEVADQFHAVVEGGRGRQDHGAGFGRQLHVFDLRQRQRRLARHEDQLAALFEVDLGGAVDQVGVIPWAMAPSVLQEQGQTTMPSVGNEPLANGAW